MLASSWDTATSAAGPKSSHETSPVPSLPHGQMLTRWLLHLQAQRSSSLLFLIRKRRFSRSLSEKVFICTSLARMLSQGQMLDRVLARGAR